MNLKLLLNAQMIRKIFIKTLTNTTQIKNVKYYSFFMIWFLIYSVIKKLNPIVTELLIRGKKLNISFAFNKILNKRELQQTARNHSIDIDFKDFMNLYKKCTAKRYSFLVIDAAFAWENPSHFRKNLLERI